MNAHTPTGFGVPDDLTGDRPLRHDSLERWVGVSAMAVLMAAGVFAVLL